MFRLLPVLLFLPFLVSAQDALDKSRSDLKKELENWAKTVKGSFKETDSSLLLTSIDTRLGEIQETSRFDKNNKCTSQTFKATCDSCMQGLLSRLLSRKSYQWKKINENQYVSRFEDRILLELPIDPGDYSFTVFRAQWTKELYDLLLKQ